MIDAVRMSGTAAPRQTLMWQQRCPAVDEMDVTGLRQLRSVTCCSISTSTTSCTSANRRGASNGTRPCLHRRTSKQWGKTDDDNEGRHQSKVRSELQQISAEVSVCVVRSSQAAPLERWDETVGDLDDVLTGQACHPWTGDEEPVSP